MKFTFAHGMGRDPFLSHGPGAEEQAMGEAVVGSITGPGSLYYNSSGLAFGDSGVNAEWIP